VEKIVNTD